MFKEKAPEPLLDALKILLLFVAAISLFVVCFVTFHAVIISSSHYLQLTLLIIACFILGYWSASIGIRDLLGLVGNEVAQITNNFDQSNLPKKRFAASTRRIEESDSKLHFVPIAKLVQSLKDQIFALSKRYDLLATNLAAAVVIYGDDKEILFCSPYIEVLTGYSSEEVRRIPNGFWPTIARNEDRTRFLKALEISRSGKDVQIKFQVSHKSGIKLWIESCMVPLYTEDGKVEAVMIVSSDVTMVLNYQHQIEEQNQDLNDFAYMVSHDLKSPLFTIKGMANALQEDYNDKLDADGQDSLTHIVDAAERLEKLISSVIEYSVVSTRSDDEDIVDLQGTIQSVIADQSRQINDKKVEIIINGNLPTIEADPIRTYQLFSNLINNAIKYRSPNRTPIISITANPPVDGMLTIDVTDNGIGIPANKLEEIFRPYIRLHGEEVEGNGIGLACVRKIIDRLGGHISVESIVDAGTTFHVTLPVERESFKTKSNTELPLTFLDH